MEERQLPSYREKHDMARDHDSYYAAEVEEHFRRGRSLTPYTTGALVVAGLVGCGIGWLIYDRMSARAEQERRDTARQTNKANARRALEMKKKGRRTEYPESATARDGMRNIPSPS
jgi:hypothetical protein